MSPTHQHLVQTAVAIHLMAAFYSQMTRSCVPDFLQVLKGRVGFAFSFFGGCAASGFSILSFGETRYWGI